MTRLRTELMLITNSTDIKRGETKMEKVYKILKSVGGTNIALGVLFIVVGITLGVINIVSGAKLLRNRRNILF